MSQQNEQPAQSQNGRPGLEGHSGPITIGEALAVAGKMNPEKTIDLAVVSAIRSAEGRATGVKEGVPGGPASQAQHVLERKTIGVDDPHNLGQILERAKDLDALKKPVNRRDAQKVSEAEMRNDPTGHIDPKGIAAAMDRAAEWNVEQGFVHANAQ